MQGMPSIQLLRCRLLMEPMECFTKGFTRGGSACPEDCSGARDPPPRCAAAGPWPPGTQTHVQAACTPPDAQEARRVLYSVPQSRHGLTEATRTMQCKAGLQRSQSMAMAILGRQSSQAALQCKAMDRALP